MSTKEFSRQIGTGIFEKRELRNFLVRSREKKTADGKLNAQISNGMAK